MMVSSVSQTFSLILNFRNQNAPNPREKFLRDHTRKKSYNNAKNYAPSALNHILVIYSLMINRNRVWCSVRFGTQEE
jgi:hypothetical protein